MLPKRMWVGELRSFWRRELTEFIDVGWSLHPCYVRFDQATRTPWLPFCAISLAFAHRLEVVMIILHSFDPFLMSSFSNHTLSLT